MGRESAGAYCRPRDFTAGMNWPGLRPSKWLRWQSCPGLALPSMLRHHSTDHRVSCRSDWPQIYSVAKNDFELLRACVCRFPCVLAHVYTCRCIQVPMYVGSYVYMHVYTGSHVVGSCVYWYAHQRPEVDVCYSPYIQRRVCLYWSDWSACPGGSLIVPPKCWDYRCPAWLCMGSGNQNLDLCALQQTV